jgi:hypothetical protein
MGENMVCDLEMEVVYFKIISQNYILKKSEKPQQKFTQNSRLPVPQ